MTDELVIDESNFNNYFFDIRTSKLKTGQVIACYTAMADLVNTFEKKNLVDLLCNSVKMEACLQVMRKLFHADEKYSFRVLIEILQDILGGLSIEEVLDKPYRYRVCFYYYTEKKYIPTDDPHWSCISLLNLKEKDDGFIKSKVIQPTKQK